MGYLTGRNPNKAGVYDFISGVNKSEDCRDLVHMQKSEHTIPEMLKSAGYATAIMGKWHCNSKFNSAAQPQPNNFGFDYWFATANNATPSHENPVNFVRNGVAVGEIKGFSCQIVMDEALGWLDKKTDKKPYYLQICFHEPHESISSPKDLVQKYLPKSINENQAQFFASVENADRAVGRLMSYLEKNKVENTIIIFTSDNGPETLNRTSKSFRSYGSTDDLKGHKLWTNEGGIRVPAIIYWKGKQNFKGTSDAVVSALDFFPTFGELTGAKLPNVGLDGESISSLIKTGNYNRKKPLIWSFYNALNQEMVAMRFGDWKILARLKNENKYLPQFENIYSGNWELVKNAKLTDFELYNIKMDRIEKFEVSKANKEVFEDMKTRLAKEYNALLSESFVWSRTTGKAE
ncbi:Arylsulfatase [Arcticibacter svalbardensis MN12-7]|uniref:Arylsulfatase n=1 Tax=Arcticibacter svalbardensis MN12-7 TaxID=1150600 RepID=R9GLG7_9SPHI|nr:Arylsulfatase [Arcticibacter svalbardensis MN12-7]